MIKTYSYQDMIYQIMKHIHQNIGDTPDYEVFPPGCDILDYETLPQGYDL